MKRCSLLIGILSGMILSSGYAETNFNRTYFLWENAARTNTDLIESIPDYNSAINWSQGKVRTEVHIPVGPGSPNIGRYFSENNNIIRDQLQQELTRAIGYIRISDVYLLKDYYNSRNDLQGDIIYSIDNAFYFPIVQRGDEFVGVAEMNFFGPAGLSEIFSRSLIHADNTNYLKISENPSNAYDGLIIDTGSLDYNPSMQMRIYDENGVLLYGPETIDRGILLKEGVCEYTTSLAKAFSSPRSGNNAFYTLPFSITGNMNCDFVINNEDAAIIFGNPSTLKAINSGNVVVVKNPPGK